MFEGSKSHKFHVALVSAASVFWTQFGVTQYHTLLVVDGVV